MLYKDKHCVGQSHASLFEVSIECRQSLHATIADLVLQANDPEQFADCFAFRQESRSAGLICEIDGVQQNEADPGDDDPLYCFDPKHAEECESHSGH